MHYINKKTFILPILILSIFTGCATQQDTKIPMKEKAITKSISLDKKKYISQANSGDLTAIIELAKQYDYQYTKEGLINFNKWYKTLDSSKDANELLSLAKIYAQDHDLFINGVKKIENLFLLAHKTGNKYAQLELIGFYFKIYQNTKARNLHDKIVDSLSEEQLERLFEIYTEQRRRGLSQEVIQKMNEKGYKKSFPLIVSELKKIIYKKDEASIKKTDKLIQDIIDEKNIQNMNEVADMYLRSSKKSISIKLYKEVLKIDEDNNHALLKMGDLYYTGSYRLKIKRDTKKGNEYIEKASNSGNLDAKLRLLKNHSKNKKDLDKYLKLKNEFLATREGKLLLSKYFYEQNDNYSANNILIELAKEGDFEAKKRLVLVEKSRYRYSHENTLLSRKWKDIVLKNGTDKEIENLIETMSSRKYKYLFKDDIQNYHLNKNKKLNIKELRILVNTYKQTRENKLKWTNELIELGDTKASFDLAKDYMRKRGLVEKNIKKAIIILEDLKEKGDIKALSLLASFYTHSREKGFVDKEKSIQYFIKAANLDDYEAQKYLARHYLCGSCNKQKKVDYKKAYYWTKKLALKGSNKHIYTLGWIYHYGKGVEIDYKKAATWYKKVEGINSGATNNLGVLYYEGLGVKKDLKRAFELYSKASKMYERNAMNNLADMYKEGIHVKKDIKKAKELYKRSNTSAAKKSLLKLKEQGL